MKTLLILNMFKNIPGKLFLIEFVFREAIPARTKDPLSLRQISGPP